MFHLLTCCIILWLDYYCFEILTGTNYRTYVVGLVIWATYWHDTRVCECVKSHQRCTQPWNQPSWLSCRTWREPTENWWKREWEPAGSSHNTSQLEGQSPSFHHVPGVKKGQRGRGRSSIKRLWDCSTLSCLSRFLETDQAVCLSNINTSYLHIVKHAVAVTLQIHVSEVEGHPLSRWYPDQIETLAVVGIVVGPIGGDDNTLAVREGTTTTRVTWCKTHTIAQNSFNNPRVTQWLCSRLFVDREGGISLTGQQLL